MDPEVVPTVAIKPPEPVREEDIPTTAARRKGYVPPPAGAPPDPFPEVGDVVEGCHLVAELGRGASGRVFLAQQESLADRPVVLKVTADVSHGEHLNLARLQHTHVMPLYWAGFLPHRGLHVLAMPYLGRTTLARLLFRLNETPAHDWCGARVLETLEAEQAALPVRVAVQEHAADVLGRLSWVEFVARTGRTLAEALAYAHRRDILHLDLKPANILITPDGDPVLLDLGVARRPIRAGTPAVPWLGGTWAFMSPEQRAAVTALAAGDPIPTAVDGRSDQYSLGLVLYLALRGELEPANPPAPEALPHVNPRVSPGLAAILARCLAEDPAARYPDCAALAEDLGRHLDDLPLRGVHDGPPERWRKWRRRRPLGLPVILLLAAFCGTAGTAGFTTYQRNEDRRRQAESALLDGQEWQRRGQHEAATRRFLAGKELADRTYGADQLRAELDRRLHQAQRLHRAEELSKAVHLMRFYALQDHTPYRLQWVLEGAGRKLWADRGLLTDRAAGQLEQAVEDSIRAELQELIILWADLHVRVAPPAHRGAAREKAREVLAEAEHLFGPSPARGDGGAERATPRAAWEFCALGRKALGEGRDADAARYIRAALDLEPLGFATNFYAGVCALRQKRYDHAVRSFSFCAGHTPYAECLLLRGQALAGLGETDRALGDFTLALAKNPELAVAYQHRGDLYQLLGRVEEAEQDRQRARRLRE